MLVRDRVAAHIGAGLHFAGDLAVAVDQVDLSVQQVNRLIITVALAEQVAPLAYFLDDDFPGNLHKAAFRQCIQRHQLLEVFIISPF